MLVKSKGVFCILSHFRIKSHLNISFSLVIQIFHSKTKIIFNLEKISAEKNGMKFGSIHFRSHFDLRYLIFIVSIGS